MIRRLSALALLALVAGCSLDIAAPAPWVPWDAIDGPLRPEVGAAPAVLRPVRAAGAPLRVVSYNVHFGADVDGIAAAILADPALATAEVFFLQEIEAYPDEGGSRTARLADALGLGYVYAPSRTAGTSGTHGLAILSALPLADVEVMQLPDVDLPISNPARIALAATVVVDGTPVRLINVHLDTRLNVPDRILQLRPAALDAPDPVVLGGDLNTNAYLWAGGALPALPVQTVASPDHQARAIDDYVRRIGYTTPTASFGTTQHTPVVDSRLDSLFLRGLASGAGGVERDVNASDHWPLWLDVVVP